MRVNIYAEEITQRVELVTKRNEEGEFTGVRFYLELPVTNESGVNISGPFLHREGDDDSSAITFWGKEKLKQALRTALSLLELRERAEREKAANPEAEVVEVGFYKELPWNQLPPLADEQ